MKSIETIVQEASDRYPETPQAAKEAAKYATEELLNSVKEFIEEHVQSVSWLPHRFWSITQPMYGDEFCNELVKSLN